MIRNATFTRSRYGRMGDATSALISGGIGAGVSIAVDAANEWMNSIQLSHDADTATTLIVNGLATQLSNLDQAYLSEPSPTCADQRAALDAYDQAWQWLQSPQACGNPSYGSAGNACISDRAPGGKYPWATYYRNPIANDPRVSGCDTAQQVLLPSLSTGTYQAQGVTATAGDATTGQIAQPVVSNALVSNALVSTPVLSATVSASTGIPNVVIIGGIALVAIMLFGGSGSRS